MERLTNRERNFNGSASVIERIADDDGFPNDFGSKVITKLADYEDLEEQGRLIKILDENVWQNILKTIVEYRNEKEIAKKPQILKDYLGIYYYSCPDCGSFLSYKTDCGNNEHYSQNKYCPSCGQKIDKAMEQLNKDDSILD